MSRQGEARERNLANVKDFWNQEADEWGDNPRVTIRDHYFRMLEIKNVLEVIKGGRSVLDIGCGTGFSTLFYSQVVDQIIGADYAEQMVDKAQRFLSDPQYFSDTMSAYSPDWAPALKGNIRFEQGNIMEIAYPDASFDVVVAERVLINLPRQEMQDEAVGEVVRVLQPGGTLAMVEVTQQGHAGIDQIREMFGLSILEKYWHNLYIDEDHFLRLAEGLGMRLEKVRRFETFQFLTKIVHPLVVSPGEPRFLAGYNKAAHLVSLEYPTYQSVAEIGFDTFFNQKFGPLLEQHDPEKLPGFERVIPELLDKSPDFSRCSHQVMFVLKRAG